MPFNLSGSDITSSFVQISNFSGWQNVPTAQSFGNNSYGQLGVTTVSTNVSSPVVIGAVSAVYNSWIDASYLRTGTGLALINQNNQAFFSGQPFRDLSNSSSPIQVGIASNWSQITPSMLDNVAIQSNGTLWTWGYNGFGQLGTSNTTNRSSPVQLGTLSIWTSIATGSYCTYGIQSNGSLWTWGNNASGQLGNNSTSNRSSPVQVGSVGDIWKSATGSGNTFLGIQSNGTLWAFGNNSYGQFGDFTNTSQSSPIQITTGLVSNWVKVSSGPTHTLAIQSNGTLWAWGSNTFGQLGLNSATNAYLTPIQVGTASNWAQISARVNASIAIQSDGTLWTWGMNTYGQLGLGDTTDRNSPTQISSTIKWSNIIDGAPSGYFMAAIQSNGTLWAWGLNSWGQLGTSDQTNYSSPVQVGTLSSWVEVSGGNSFAVGLQNNGTAWAWGNNSFGQLGTGNLNHRSSPAQVGAGTYLTNFNSIYACGYSTLATLTSGALWAWGSNSYGQLGTTDTSTISTPTQISSYGASGWKIVSGTDFSGVAIQSNGNLWTFGLNSWGQLGTNNRTNYSTPAQIGQWPWAKVFSNPSGNGYFLGLRTDGSLWGSGNNSYGQLGVGSAGANIISPVMALSSNWTQLSAGPSHVLAVASNGTLWAWGNNSYGQLGINSYSSTYVSPIQIGTQSNWSQIFAGFLFSIAIQSNGTLWSWGANSQGQLGQNNQLTYLTPTQVGTSSTWSSISCGYYQYTNAIQSNGTLWTWGNNSYGQLGLGDLVHRSSPTQVGTLSNWTRVTAGYGTTVAIQYPNTIWTWGNNNQGQLGLYNSGAFPITSAYPQQFNNTYGGFKKVTASYSQVYYQTVNDIIFQSSVIDIPWIDSTNSISWNSYDTGNYHFVGIKNDGTAWSIGNNSYGQLGYSTLTTTSFTPISFAFTNRGIVALQSNGTLWAWGNNSYGQIGNGNQINYSSPVQVGALSNWSSISSGGFNYYNVAIQSNGTLWTWGENRFGQLGLSDTTNRSSPVQIGTNSYWTQVACGYQTTLAIQSDSTLWAWGQNIYGQLGTGNQTNYYSPIQVGTFSNWARISSGQNFWHGILSDGTLWACGYNAYGQLGAGNTSTNFSVVQIGALSVWSRVAGGRLHALAIQSNGTLWAWGSNSYGQLGLNTLTNYSSPVQVGNLSNWSQITCGYTHTVALQSNGTLWAWGNNSFGQLGMINTGNFSSPIQIGYTSTWTQIGCGYYSTAALQNNGTIWSWGNNSFGVLGLNTSTANYSSPVQAGISITGSSIVSTLTQIGSGSNWSKAICADYGSMLIDNSNNGWVFGNNNQYQLGLSDTTNRSSPVQITYATGIKNAAIDNSNFWLIDGSNNLWSSGVGNTNNFNLLNIRIVTLVNYSSPMQIYSSTPWATIAAGRQFAAGIQSNGTLWAWGYNASGQLGQSNTTDRSSPIQIGTNSYWSQVSCGYASTFALQNNGTLWAWGNSANGQLGLNTTTIQPSPIQVGTNSNWAQISAGAFTCMAIQSNGTLWMWGNNNRGQLGQSNTTLRSSPVQVGLLSVWTKIAAGQTSSAAIQSDGTLWMWGENNYGQLGLSDAVNRSSPVQVGALNVWTQVACGYSTIALQNNGTLWAWGLNSLGQLGTNNQTNYSSPVQIGLLSSWSRLSSGNPNMPFYNMAIQSNGTLWAWGANSYGTLGVNDTTLRSSPTQVGTLSTWTRVALGGYLTLDQFPMALQSNGTLWSWGSNAYYQAVPINNYTFPVQRSPSNFWADVKTNQNSTLFLDINNTFWSYGNNTFGQFGTTPATSYQFAVTPIGSLNTGVKMEIKAGSSTIFTK